jgi:hypothetical protein
VRIAAAALFLASLVTSSCGSTANPAADLSVHLDTNDFGTFVLDIYDASGLVIDGRSFSKHGRSGPAIEPEFEAHPQRNEIDVWWLGGACSHRPRLHVSGDSSHLALEVTPDYPDGPTLGGALASCPAVGLGFGVTLILSTAFDQSQVTTRKSE